jgi:hypothetical protein
MSFAEDLILSDDMLLKQIALDNLYLQVSNLERMTLILTPLRMDQDRFFNYLNSDDTIDLTYL